MDIKMVQAVDKDTGNVAPRLGDLSMRDSAKKDKLLDVMVALRAQRGERGAVLKDNMGDAYVDVLREVGFGKHLAETIRLFQEFELAKQGYYVKLA